MLRDADEHRVRLPRPQLAAATRGGGARSGRRRLSRRTGECHYHGVEFASDDRRRRGRQRRPDDGERLARGRPDLGEAQSGHPRQRGSQHRSDQPVGVHARGAQPATRAVRCGAAAAGRHHPAESVVDLSLNRANPVVAGARRQRRRTRADRGDHPQLQRRACRAGRRCARSDQSLRHVRRDARPTTRQHRRVHPGTESDRRHLRGPA